MNVAYVRVSTAEQNEARQKEALEKYDIEKWFIEKVSAKDTDREEFQRMMDFVREGDTIYIHDFSRLAKVCIFELALNHFENPASSVHSWWHRFAQYKGLVENYI